MTNKPQPLAQENMGIYNKKLIEACAVDFLPNKVLFAMGDSEDIKCASLWIKELQAKIQELENELKRERECVDDLILSDDHADFCNYKRDIIEDCNCMDRHYYGTDGLLTRARQTQALRNKK